MHAQRDYSAYVNLTIPEFFKPRILVPDACVERRCRGLQRAVEEAALDAFKWPGFQIIVVTDKHRGIFCRPEVHTEGDWSGMPDGRRILRENPGMFLGGGSVEMVVVRALARGAHYYTLRLERIADI